MSDDSKINDFIRLLHKLKKSDLTTLIWLAVCVYLYGHLASILANKYDAFTYPFNLILTVVPLGSILLVIVFITLNFISKNIKNRNNEEDLP